MYVCVYDKIAFTVSCKTAKYRRNQKSLNILLNKFHELR